MASTKFMAVLPQTVQAGDKILIKGKTEVDAKQFSINFANDTEASPQNITYHFKWILSSDRIVENYKMNGIWMDHLESDYNALDGRFASELKLSNSNASRMLNGFEIGANGDTPTARPSNDNDTNSDSTSNSILGPTFALEFAFQDDGIYVYLVDGDGRNLVSHYHPEFELVDIESVQVWGDVEKINELTFSYK